MQYSYGRFIESQELGHSTTTVGLSAKEGLENRTNPDFQALRQPQWPSRRIDACGLNDTCAATMERGTVKRLMSSEVPDERKEGEHALRTNEETPWFPATLPEPKGQGGRGWSGKRSGQTRARCTIGSRVIRPCTNA